MEEKMTGDRQSHARRRLSVLITTLAVLAVAVAATGCVVETDGGYHHHWHGWHEWR
jgi:hypothetical protein